MPHTHHPPSPAKLGYRMPAEWEPHAATWLSWPKPDGISFPGSYDHIPPILAKMIDALADSEPVHINVVDADEEAVVRGHLQKNGARTEHVRFFHIPTNEPWCRDHGPIFIVRDKDPKLAITDWDYNAWGFKYPPFDLDDDVPSEIAEKLGLPVYYPEMVLEGGSIEVNGAGTLLTTKSCLLNPNRNPDLSKKEIEHRIEAHLGVRKIIWLGDGIEGDDTDGHIDDLTRFVSPTKVLTVIEEDEDSANYEPLRANYELLINETTADGKPLQVVRLPMPARIVREGQVLPASYANFYIANKAVLLPIFHDTNDKWAISIIEHAFPDRRIVPIDCRELVWGLGAFHCLTQQMPLV
jgi:agmatine deiminase